MSASCSWAELPGKKAKGKSDSDALRAFLMSGNTAPAQERERKQGQGRTFYFGCLPTIQWYVPVTKGAIAG